MMPHTLPDWLTYIESLHPQTIELGLQRINQVKQSLNLQLHCPIITVGGTNGKGSTCAMLAAILLQAGYRVGVYTSPHLLRFNERLCINGQPVDDATLCAAFARVEQARGQITLTYFEFTTLALLHIMAHANLDAAILEVGLGGRLDAVNCLDADCAIVTSIDLDHMDYLGDTREQIGWEKAHIFRTGRPAICSDPQPPQSLLDYAREINADLWCFGRDFNYQGDKQQWGYAGRTQRRNSLAYPALRGANQLLNAAAALAALEALQERLPVAQQAVRQGLALVELPGRFQVLAGRPTVILDVAHNPHAAAVLAHNLDSMSFHPATHAVFGMLQDKDIAGVMATLRDRIDHWYLCDLPGPRGTPAAQLQQQLEQAGITPQPATANRPNGCSIQTFTSPHAALQAAQKQAQENDRILVFGSFYTVADVLAQRLNKD